MLTNWGYSVEELTDILTVAECRAITGTEAPDAMVEAGIKAAQAAIRNNCGWHVAPPLQCVYETESAGFREIQLPATFVKDVTATIDGQTVDVEAKHTGRIRRADGKPVPESWGSVEVSYTAGVDASQVKQLVAKLAASAVASPAGIRSESIGSASVTYASTEIELTSNVQAVLGAYRVKARP